MHVPPLLILAALLLPLAACTSKEEEPSSAGKQPVAAAPKPVVHSGDAVLLVGDRKVTVGQFKAAFSRVLPGDREVPAEEREQLQSSFLRQLLDQELTLSEADRLQLSITDAEIEKSFTEFAKDYPGETLKEMLLASGLSEAEWKDDLRRRLLIEKVIRTVIDPRILVSEEDIAAYYEEHIADFDRPDEVRARQIVVSTEEEGRKVLGLLRQGTSFEDLARQYSQSPDSADGGDLGFFARGQMPAEFDEVVFSLPVGRVSELIKSDYGFHLFRVEEQRPARKLTLDYVRDQIEEQLRRSRKGEVYRSWLKDLGTRTDIEVNWSLL